MKNFLFLKEYDILECNQTSQKWLTLFIKYLLIEFDFSLSNCKTKTKGATKKE